MSAKPERANSPAIVSYTSFTSFLNQLREQGVPSRIDKSLMPKASGSQISVTLQALRFLGLIDESGKPTPSGTALIQAADEDRKPLFEKIVKSAYAFLFEDEEFNLESATSQQMAEKFRSLDIQGSTVTKAIAFFLAVAKEGQIKVSAHIKPPAAPRNGNAAKKPAKQKDSAQSAQENDSDEDEDDEDVERFEIPVPNKRSVRVIVPSDLDADDWEMLQSMITVYIKRWKQFKDEGPK